MFEQLKKLLLGLPVSDKILFGVCTVVLIAPNWAYVAAGLVVLYFVVKFAKELGKDLKFE